MVRLTDPRQEIEIELPSFPGSQVKMKKGLTVGQQMEILEKYPKASDSTSGDAQKAGMEMVVKSIVSRNFTDDNDQPLQVTLENLLKLPMDDLSVLLSNVTPQEKKS